MAEGTLSMAIEAVTTMAIVKECNIPHQYKNGKDWIICPNPKHDDNNIGSCYIDKNDNGYYCYACQESVDKWNMLLQAKEKFQRETWTKKQAADWFFETSGITPMRGKPVKNPLEDVMKLIKRITNYVNNDVVYNDKYPCAKIDSSYGRNINGDYFFSELSMGDPLLELYKINKELFKQLSLKKLTEKEKLLIKLRNHCDENKDKKILVAKKGGYVNLKSYKEFLAVCEEQLADIHDLKNTIKAL